MTDDLVSWINGRLVPDRQLSFQPQATNNIYRTKDGKYIALTIAYEQHFWRNFCRVINKEELIELSPNERTERSKELSPMLKDIFLGKTRDEWLQVLTKADVPHGPVYDSQEEVLSDPQLRHRGMVVETDDSENRRSIQIGSPFLINGIPKKTGGQPPKLGEHTEEILLSLGYDDREIETIKKGGVI